MLLPGCCLPPCVRRDKCEREAVRFAGSRVSDEPALPSSSSSSVGKGSGGTGTAARRFAWAEIESVTAGFSSRVIGQGGFSTVYLACLSSSRLGAVKVQRGSSERLHRAFRRELDVLLSLRHPHVVRLLGYCDEREEGVLVFEYAANGDLHERLHGATRPPLPWSRRMAIAFQVATALECLHESRDPAVIHGDVKASNVLLDANLDAKLCDLGSAHVGFSATVHPPQPEPAHRASARRPVMGSPGYVDPHFLRSGVATKKSDVYSFGVLLLELLTGREAVVCAVTGRRLTAAVCPALDEGRNSVADVIDPRLLNEYDAEEAATVGALALRCVSDSPGLRPSMAEVVREFQEKTTALFSAAGSKPAGKVVSS